MNMVDVSRKDAAAQFDWREHVLMALGPDQGESDVGILLKEININKPETIPAEAQSILYHRIFLNFKTAAQTVRSMGLVVAGKRLREQDSKISIYSSFAGLYRSELARTGNTTPLVIISGYQIDREGGLTEQGLVKALCVQLIHSNPGAFNFDWMDESRMSRIWGNSVEDLLIVFERLLQQLSQSMRDKVFNHDVVVLIDGLNLLERTPGFKNIVKWLRELASLVEKDARFEGIVFKYVLVNPYTTRINVDHWSCPEYYLEIA